ncbi:hypothetical protein SAMN05661096_00607 [Marivirga sericea]|uniref:DUF5777 domain-containing protein n=1 Tax=Marivirga sericea TaxID=1028 RepID=A0A1X7IGU5_9BACT|nr:DUF5777 family beta-barrel protein [Marivirga sericea]SMG13624.1 hypothetical protein SAMN05661096_00607 [Marivirga sericea]
MKYIFIISIFCLSLAVKAQENDLMALLNDQTEEPIIYAEATFKGSRLINGHTVQTRKAKAFEFLISHRFGRLNSGAYELFGIDGANIRLGFEYGLSDRITIGLGRNSFEKTFDSFMKVKLLKQSKGRKVMPFSAVFLTSAALKTLKGQEGFTTTVSKLTYTHQLLIARKFNNSFSFQVMPTIIHRNMILVEQENSDVFALGVGGRFKLTQRVSLNAEYYQRFDVPEADLNYNSLAVGVDIETGGHVFQLHLTNSRAMIEKGFITETSGDFFNGDIHFGFNVSRVF